jgi:hypothetical protein
MPEFVDLARIMRAVKTTPEEYRLWSQLPEPYRAGLQKGFSLGLQFAMDFEEEAKRRREGSLTEDERRAAKETRMSEILQSVLG